MTDAAAEGLALVEVGLLDGVGGGGGGGGDDSRQGSEDEE